MIAPMPHPAMTLVFADSFTTANAMSCTENATAALIHTARVASGDSYMKVITHAATAMSPKVAAAKSPTDLMRNLAGRPADHGACLETTLPRRARALASLLRPAPDFP